MKPVFFDDVLKALEAGFATGHNVLLYGPPGHNKSNGAEWFFKSKGVQDVFIKSISGGTSIEDMYGGIDIKKMRDTGQILYRLDEPEFFGNHEYVVFDEILDAKEKVLASLKDTIMAREVRNGSQRKALQTKMIIGLTNVDAKDFEDNWERAAILERFPIRVLVKWDNYTNEAFTELIKAVTTSAEFTKVKNFASKIAMFAASSHEEGDKPITPRAVVQAVRAVLQTGNEEHGWIMVNQNRPDGAMSVPREVVLKWRMQTIESSFMASFKAKDFASCEKKRLYLSAYSAKCSKQEAEMIQPVLKKISDLLFAEIL